MLLVELRAEPWTAYRAPHIPNWIIEEDRKGWKEREEWKRGEERGKERREIMPPFRLKSLVRSHSNLTVKRRVQCCRSGSSFKIPQVSHCRFTNRTRQS